MFFRVSLAIPVVLFAVLIAGCGPSQANIEKSIRETMKSQQGVTITSIDLRKQADGTYVGTATADNGDVYDVNTLASKNSMVEWKALPGPAMVEKRLREGLEQQLGKIKSLQLTKHAPGSYEGSAELTTGAKLIVTTRMNGNQIMWEAKPANE
jgi:hypothetical protein